MDRENVFHLLDEEYENFDVLLDVCCWLLCVVCVVVAVVSYWCVTEIEVEKLKQNEIAIKEHYASIEHSD